MKTRRWFGWLLVMAACPVMAQYPCEPGVLELLFDQNACVRLRKDALVDLTGSALTGVDEVLRDMEQQAATVHAHYRTGHAPVTGGDNQPLATFPRPALARPTSSLR